ncbi:glycoside hydrolase family 88/105 protein [Bifidobacterium saguinibicoloris]|uniref:beta-galactosidase BglB n=1 Tax=Bifidobacterium saguinibicoloris TaxID=2834433 RepID=UPI001C58605B|nr:glycoside hydrolase family 88 protein [Bifidobacterium saguinibicoloris]MBW3080490.1 glycoside hydrolase family 88 protein [Bifidobacterium saguinibicoloris]
MDTPQMPATRDQLLRLIDAMSDNLVTIASNDGEGLWKVGDVVIDDKSWNVWNWPQGVGLYGLYRTFEVTGSAKALDAVRQWYERAFAQGTPPKNVNTMCPLLTMALLYERTGDPKLRPYLEQWAKWAYEDMPRTDHRGMQHITLGEPHHNQLWADTLVMTVLPLAKIGRMLGISKYVEEAKYQFQIHIKYLADNASGLWYHGWTFDERHNFVGAHWARGNCWATMAIPEAIAILGLDERDALRTWLVETLEAQVEALAEHQDASGLWHTLIDDETSYLESSGTAGIAYGILKAVHTGLLDERFLDVAYKAVKGLIAQIGPYGEVGNVSVGTGMGADLDYYRNIEISPMPYGQSLTILAFTEMLVSYC